MPLQPSRDQYQELILNSRKSGSIAIDLLTVSLLSAFVPDSVPDLITTFSGGGARISGLAALGQVLSDEKLPSHCESAVGLDQFAVRWCMLWYMQRCYVKESCSWVSRYS